MHTRALRTSLTHEIAVPESKLVCGVSILQIRRRPQAGTPLFRFRGITIFGIGDSLMTLAQGIEAV